MATHRIKFVSVISAFILLFPLLSSCGESEVKAADCYSGLKSVWDAYNESTTGSVEFTVDNKVTVGKNDYGMDGLENSFTVTLARDGERVDYAAVYTNDSGTNTHRLTFDTAGKVASEVLALDTGSAVSEIEYFNPYLYLLPFGSELDEYGADTIGDYYTLTGRQEKDGILYTIKSTPKLIEKENENAVTEIVDNVNYLYKPLSCEYKVKISDGGALVTVECTIRQEIETETGAFSYERSYTNTITN